MSRIRMASSAFCTSLFVITPLLTSTIKSACASRSFANMASPMPTPIGVSRNSVASSMLVAFKSST
nr:MAG TPA: hypothetical protein [Caudoviricetes sp.]DAO22333.1 MAG TPA: hypothetical protein [Caudoviricetes sp.]